MTGLEQAINQYGYLAVFIGAVLEGETALLAGAMAAGGGLLDLRWVALAACMGGCSGDFFFYFMGLAGGNKLLSRMPGLLAKSKNIRRRISGKSTWIILFCRFVYGLRSVIPLTCAVSGVRPMKFMLLDLISGILWAAFYSLAGAGLGEWFSARINRLGELWLPVACLAVFALAGLCLAAFVKRRAASGQKHNAELSGKDHNVP